MDPFWTGTLIFILAYAVIVSEKIHKTKVALIGATLMLVLKILTQSEAFHSEEFGIDYNVIFLLIGMMIIIGIMKKTGAFEYVAIKSAKLGRGEPFRILTIFAIITAIASALLDNVTTVLLLAPVTLLIADELDIDPIPFLISEALASNIGGTATLIGDPPNIMIASKARLTFMDFIIHLTPVIIIIMIVFLFTLKLIFKKKLRTSEKLKERIMNMNEREMIKDAPLLKKCLVVLSLTVLGFVLHGTLHLEPATIALTGAAVLFLISGEDPHTVFMEVEWPTIFFFIGLFIIVGGVVKVGLIDKLSQFMIEITHPTKTSMFNTSMVMLWFSAFTSAIVDNIPFVATMNPLILDMANTIYHGGSAVAHALPPETIHNSVLMPVWWSLALGACLGGNGTAIGASANVIIVGMAEKSKRPISFLRFMAYGFPIMVETLIIAMIYVWVRYYLLA
ncbi:MAG: ArsB/NhaD family transporter [Deltaproteobacteria bacterium]|nr:ArsB/NhaD family transporter [Deltaproteobacteria bacterium]